MPTATHEAATMSQLYDVVIAGAGPVGLFLACELALARITVLVLERDLQSDLQWKEAPLGLRGLNTLSTESFYRRGILKKFFDREDGVSPFQKTSRFQFGGHFAGIPLNANELDLSRWKYLIPGPALTGGGTTLEHLEKVLLERAETLGVTILRGNGVTKIIAEDDKSVTVEAGENQSFRGRWLVGCDGGKSVVRKAAGFDFIGSEPKFTGYVTKCDLDPPDVLKKGFNITRNGMYIIAFPGSLYLLDFDDGAAAANLGRRDLSKEHMQDVMDRVLGTTDVKIKNLHLASSFTDRAKQTTSYRKGRILLAGDSCHIHPPLGGQGLNLGLGDAMNLGWKLAATVRQELESEQAPLDLTLIDTYEKERHPVGASILEFTRAQVSLLQPGPYGVAMQGLIRDLINTTDGANLFLDRFWGLSRQYDLSDGETQTHPVVGRSAPDFEMNDGSRLNPKLCKGQGLLIDFENDGVLKELVNSDKYKGRVEFIGMGAKDQLDLRALLVRPDGFVAWAAESNTELDQDALEAALERWFKF